MDKEILVERIHKSIEELEKKEGDFSLVMIVPIDPNSSISLHESKLNIIISSQWFDQIEPRKAINIVYESLKNTLKNDELANISRINVINSSDNLVKAANSAFDIEHGDVELTNVNLFGIQIPRAVILESKIPLPVRGITNIAKKSGNRRIEPDAMKLIIKITEDYISNLTKKANEYAKQAGRDTINTNDIEKAAKSFKKE